MRIDEALKTPEDRLAEFRTVFKGIHAKHERKKGRSSRAGTAKRKQKRFRENVERVRNVFVKSPKSPMRKCANYSFLSTCNYNSQAIY